MTRLTAGQLARRAGVNLQTIRYYERRALLVPQDRTASGYRQYDVDAVDRLFFIKRAQALGFTLEEVARLLALGAGPAERCTMVEREAREVVARIDRRIADLREIREALVRLVDSCPSRQGDSECPLLEALTPDGTGLP